ncbi:SDR family oxidoreductase, partial [uncultured Amnibacterium sp.]|uniref:SDR family oxidoreductase n=1 Tax=uncultured Amnibacterium sp. TaxID=1631851 RepID=UPI0035CA5F6B
TAVLTGLGRRRGIAAALAVGLARDGWNLVLPILPSYDERLGIGGGAADIIDAVDAARGSGVEVVTLEADLADPDAPSAIFDAADALGQPAALVLAHSESVDSSILTTTVESWDRHFAVNARAAWLLIRALGERLPAEPTTETIARVIALTSDHTAHNLPYGASKGALDRLVIAAAIELGDRGLRANVINPGPIDTGWMDDGIRASAVARTPIGRLGAPQDTTDLVRFLLSDAGGWITGQRLHSSGGLHTSG